MEIDINAAESSFISLFCDPLRLASVVVTHIMINTALYYVNKSGKAVPSQAWTGPESS